MDLLGGVSSHTALLVVASILSVVFAQNTTSTYSNISSSGLSVASVRTSSFSNTSSSHVSSSPSLLTPGLTSTPDPQTSTAIGGYIAVGLGLSSTASDGVVASSTMTSASLAPSTNSSRAIYASASKSVYGDDNNSSPLRSVTTASGTTNITSPAGNDSNACISQWEDYYVVAANFTSTSVQFSISTSRLPPTTETIINTFYDVSVYESTVNTATEFITTIETLYAGQYPQTTTETLVSTIYDVSFSETTVSASTATNTITETYDSLSFFTSALNSSLPTPTCSRPAVLPSCQSEWEAWVATATQRLPSIPPHCTWTAEPVMTTPGHPFQNISADDCFWTWYSTATNEPYGPLPTWCPAASIVGQECQALRQAYARGENQYLWPAAVRGPGGDNEVYFFNGFYGTYTDGIPPTGTYLTWPTSTTLAPGCTLGCGQCAVTGGTIQLLYFLPGQTHPATAPVTYVTGGTTLTSPTFYIAIETVYASDACSGIGPTITSTIVAIPTTDTLSSLWGIATPLETTNALEEAPGPVVFVGTASYNITDIIQSPVPYSIYASQLICQTAVYMNRYTPLFTCNTALPYRPIIVLPDQVLQAIDPAWATCSGDLRGFYDPPKPLTEASSAAAPLLTPSDASTTVPATPAPSLSTVAAPTTSAGDPPASTPSAAQTIERPPQATSAGSAADTQDPTADDPNQRQSAQTVASGSENALSVLSAAELTFSHAVSVQGAPSSYADPAAGGSQTTRVVTTNVQAAQTQAVVTGTASSSVTVIRQGSSALLIAGSSSTTIALGAQATFAEQSLSVVSSGNAVVVAGSTISFSAPNAAQTNAAPQAVITAGSGQLMTVMQSGTELVVKDGSTVVTLGPGSVTVLEGQTLRAASSAGVAIFGGSTISLTQAAVLQASGLSATPDTDSSGHIVAITMSNSQYIIADGSTTFTLGPGSQTVRDGQTISAAPASASGYVIVGSSTVRLSSAKQTGGWIAETALLDPSGHILTIVELSSQYLVQNSFTTVALAPGSQTVVDGETISAPLTATNTVVVDGSTLVLSPVPIANATSMRSSTTMSASGPASASTGPATTSASKQSGASAPMGPSSLLCVLLALLGMAVSMWK